jgi:enamine deaminase RidA (YjgF/YER057c/UK114 family)
MSKRFFAALARWPTCVAAGPFLFFSAQMGLRAPGQPYMSFVEGEASGRGPGAGSDFDWLNRMEAPVGAQAIAIYERYRELLAADKGELGNLLRYHIYQRDKRFFPLFDHVRRHYEPAPPASSAVGVGRFEPDDKARLGVDAIALRSAAARTVGARTVLGGSSKHAAAAHFSQVIGAGPYLFLAGQLPVDTSRPGSPLIRNYDDIPQEGRFLSVGRSHEDARNGPIAAQTWYTYDLIRKHLEGVGSALDQVLNLVVYLQDMRDFPTFHRVHERFFGGPPPALTVVEVGEVGHKGTLIEIEPTAIVPGRSVRRKVFEAPRGARAAHMSAAVESGGLAFLSGIPGVAQDGGPATALNDLPAPWRRYARASRARRPDEIAVQTAAVIGQLDERMRQMGRDLSRVVHLTVFVEDIGEFMTAAPMLEKAFGKWRPALAVVEVARPSPLAGVRISGTAIAWIGDDEPAVLAS